MDDKIYFLTKELKNALDNDERIVRLNELEKVMNDNEEVMALSYRKDVANDRYNDLLKIYKEDDEVVIKARQELIKKKEELESHPAVKEYLKAYSEVRMLLFELNNILFKDFKGGNC